MDIDCMQTTQIPHQMQYTQSIPSHIQQQQVPLHIQQQHQVPPPHFGIVIPGRSLLTEFEAISETKYISFINDPINVSEITFFLIPSSPLPAGYGVILYYSLHPFQNWEIIGAIDPLKPSGTFRTGWPLKEEFRGATIVQLGIALETLDNIKNLEIQNNGVEDRLAFAHKIALDLFQYMTSNAPSSSSNQMMVVPTNIFDRWMERFDRKYKLDPNFMLKQSI